MIDDLRVRGMGGIREAVLRFRGNFIVITGESGAGKSSLVRAFEFISGKRAQVSSIYGGADEVTVQALFQIDETQKVQEQDSSDKSLLAERYLSRNGRGKCQLQGNLVSLGQLADILQNQIGIQSQFAQLGLLDPQKQMELVDSCGSAPLKETKDELQRYFAEVLASEKELLHLRSTRKEMESAHEGSELTLRQIRGMKLSADSEQQWEEDLKQLEYNEMRREKLQGMSDLLSGASAGNGLLDEVESLCRDLYTIAPEEEMPQWTALGEKALTSLQQLFSIAAGALNAVMREDTESEREKIEGQLGALRKIKRELNCSTVEQLLVYADSIEKDLEWLRGSNALIDAKNKETEFLRRTVGRLVVKLRSQRQAAAKSLEESVLGHLKSLGMEDCLFTINVIPQEKIRSTGAEAVQFSLSRKDLPPGPVAKNASGGELSRILVALQASLGNDALPGVLVFDEVEAGLGGRAAMLTARKLQELSRRCQIILITHEATIAAIAEQHFVVKRHGDDTDVLEITGEERAYEIARMLAGTETPEALKHAQALLRGEGI